MVALKDINADEILPMLRWCDSQGFDLTLIETMPLGETGEDRTDHYLPLSQVAQEIDAHHALTSIAVRTGGPARYHDVEGLGIRLGLITPLTRIALIWCSMSVFVLPPRDAPPASWTQRCTDESCAAAPSSTARMAAYEHLAVKCARLSQAATNALRYCHHRAAANCASPVRCTSLKRHIWRRFSCKMSAPSSPA